MLEEEQLAAGPQYPRDLLQYNVGAVDRAQHEGRDDRVDRSVGEWQPFRRRVHHFRPPAAAVQLPLKAGAHRGVWFRQDQIVKVVGVVRQVQAGAAADLERAPARVAEQSLSVSAQSGPLAHPDEGVIQECESACPSRVARWNALRDLVLHAGDGTDTKVWSASLTWAISPEWPIRVIGLRAGRGALPQRPPPHENLARAYCGCSRRGGARCAGSTPAVPQFPSRSARSPPASAPRAPG